MLFFFCLTSKIISSDLGNWILISKHNIKVFSPILWRRPPLSPCSTKSELMTPITLGRLISYHRPPPPPFTPSTNTFNKLTVKMITLSWCDTIYGDFLTLDWDEDFATWVLYVTYKTSTLLLIGAIFLLTANEREKKGNSDVWIAEHPPSPNPSKNILIYVYSSYVHNRNLYFKN